MKRIVCLTLSIVMIFLAGCTGATTRDNTRTKFSSYKDIPGVTKEEIAAIDQLLAERPVLDYGVCLSTEAFFNDDGVIGGFDKLLGNRLTELFGFEFDFHVLGWEEMNAQIRSMDIDLVSELTATPERRETLFMTDALFQRVIRIFTLNDSEMLVNTAKKRSIICAFTNGSTTYSRVSDTWGLPFVPIFINDQSEIPQLLMSGQIDAYIEEGTQAAIFKDLNAIKVEDYYPLSYSPISLTTGNPELAPLISVIQKYLNSGGAFEISEMYKQGYNDYQKYNLISTLTDEEIEYISRHGTDNPINIACENYNYPISFYNARDKAFQGAAIDVLEQVSALTGLSFKIGSSPDATWPEILAGVESGEYSMVSELLHTNARKGRFLWLDEPYYMDSYAMVSRADYPDVDMNQILFSTVGLLDGTAYTDLFFEWFPNSVNTVTFEGKDDAIPALEKGEIDLLMVSQNFLLHFTNYLEKTGFKTNLAFNYAAGSSFGFNVNEEILCSIINKVQRSINTQDIATYWQQKTFDYQSKFAKDIIPYLVVFAVLLLIGIVAIFLMFMKNKKIGRSLEILVAERTKQLALQTSTLTTIFESIPDLVFCKDINLQFTRCNQSFEQHFGCLEADIIGETQLSRTDASSVETQAIRDIETRVLNEGIIISVEELIPDTTGKLRVFETVKIPLMQDGGIEGLMCIARDITERKVAEDTVKLTLDNLDTCIYVTEIETGKILFMNSKMKKEFGIEKSRGKVCWEVLQSGFSERCEFCPVPKLMESSDEYYVWEKENTLTGKSYKNVDSLIRWHDGRLVHMQHSVDITAAVKLQHELEDASRAKGDFLSRMSHEIRTPLNAIIGMNNIAMSNDDIEKMHHCHERIDNASRHLLGIINDILDMSKIEADKFELSMAEFNLEKMLMNVTNVINFRTDEKVQNLVLNLSEDIPTFIISDDLRLAQVITNLLTNAVKFTPEQGTIVLSIEKLDETNDEVTLQFAVEDNGIGISDEQKSRLFTSFEQADGGISRKFGGTGLGLAISKRIVEFLGGTIWIESELGRGSKFIFTMTAQKGRQKTRSSLSPKLNRDNVQMLLVDDCVETREYFTSFMDAHKLPCDVVSSGSEALDKINTNGESFYNIYFVDWQMPEMDGIELTRKIKEITGDNSIIIMISANDWDNVKAEAISAGVRHFIPKPLFPSAIINTINECFGVDSARDEKHRKSDYESARNYRDHKILVVDDVEINREIIAAILEESEIAIDFAENGIMAISTFEKNIAEYSLILMDVQMPEMDGYEATRRIRAMGAAKAQCIPIIAMTAHVFQEDVIKCLEAGMNDHVGKPIDSDILFEKLRIYLS